MYKTTIVGEKKLLFPTFTSMFMNSQGEHSNEGDAPVVFQTSSVSLPPFLLPSLFPRLISARLNSPIPRPAPGALSLSHWFQGRNWEPSSPTHSFHRWRIWGPQVSKAVFNAVWTISDRAGSQSTCLYSKYFFLILGILKTQSVSLPFAW